jgi:NitT/TauT family transport system substrate-binding protein
MSNGEATAAMLSGRTEVKSHMTLLPYSTVEYATGKIRPIVSTKDIIGGPVTATMAFATVKFHDQNPKVYAAIAAAYQDAVQFIKEHPKEAAEIYIRHEPQKMGATGVLKLMVDDKLDDLSYTTTPQGMKAFADFMAKTGLIKSAPEAWTDLFFENQKGQPGS